MRVKMVIQRNPMQIDFYYYVAQPMQFACRLVQKAYRSGAKLLILTENEAASAAFDQLLWTFDAYSFVPHCWVGEDIAAHTPVWLAHEWPESLLPVILNLSRAPLPDPLAFERVLEIVGVDENELANAREVARQYRRSGFEIAFHDCSAVRVS